jgi:hypothetical protein
VTNNHCVLTGSLACSKLRKKDYLLHLTLVVRVINFAGVPEDKLPAPNSGGEENSIQSPPELGSHCVERLCRLVACGVDLGCLFSPFRTYEMDY